MKLSSFQILNKLSCQDYIYTFGKPSGYIHLYQLNLCRRILSDICVDEIIKIQDIMIMSFTTTGYRVIESVRLQGKKGGRAV